MADKKKEEEPVFSQDTKINLGSRAGYICSKPTCDRITIGPSNDKLSFTIFGEAAHIYSKSERGPRGSGSLTPDELKSQENGIWLCNNCHNTIDKERGINYTAAQLHSYKKLHELKIYNMVHGIKIPIFWLYSIQIKSNSYGFESTNVLLSKVNVITGENGVGKSLFAELIIGAFQIDKLTRWRTIAIDYDLVFFNPEEHRLNLVIENSIVKINEEENDYIINPYITQIITMTNVWFNEAASEIRRLADIMNVSESQLIEWINKNDFSNGYRIKKVKIVEEVDEEGTEIKRLKFQLEDSNRDRWRSFALLSGTEIRTFILDIAISMAKYLSKYNYIILYIDTGDFNALPQEVKNYYIEELLQETVNFQTIIVVPEIDETQWFGWRKINLIEEGKLVKIISS